MQAQAVIFTEPGQVQFRDVRCPDPTADDVVVRVRHSWISNGTEGSYLRGERVAGDTPRREGDPWPFPIVPGYQKVGVVEWVGANIRDVAVGEWVFAAMGRVEGMFSPFGGHVSPSVSPRQHIWTLPPAADPLAFAGLVLTQVGYNCGVRAPLTVGDGAVVVGDGLVGQWAAQTLAWRGAAVVLVGRHPDRLAKFAPGPFRHTLNAHTTPDWRAQIPALLPQGVRVGVDTVGSVAAMADLTAIVGRDGHIVSAGFYGTADGLALQPLRYGERSVDLVSGWTAPRMEQTRFLVAAGHLQTLPLITHRFPVAQAADAWHLIQTKTEPVLGVILDWDNEQATGGRQP